MVTFNALARLEGNFDVVSKEGYEHFDPCDYGIDDYRYSMFDDFRPIEL